MKNRNVKYIINNNKQLEMVCINKMAKFDTSPFKNENN